MKANKNSNYLMVAAVLITIYCIYSLYEMFIPDIIDNGFEVVFNWYLNNINLYMVINVVFCICMPIALFTKDKKFIALISGLEAIEYIYSLITNISYGYTNIYIYIEDVLAILRFGFLSFLLYLSYKEKRTISKIWYMPSLLMLIYLAFLTTVLYIPEISQGISILVYFPSIIFNIIFVISFYFIGLWAKNSVPLSSFVIKGGADELIAYKEMLDAGEITQEEFDSKKKDIIG